MPRASIVVHGGAGALPDAAVPGALAGTEAAARAGAAVLAAGGSALDAVEAAVRVLEDLPQFNAGTGSVLTAEGHVEMDALVCEGADLRAGAVTGATTARHAVSLARAVMERTPHVLLTGAAADAFALTVGAEVVTPESLVTDARRAQLARELARRGGAAAAGGGGAVLVPAAPAPAPTAAAPAAGGAVAVADAGDHDTVGAVAIDARGNVASATSTGGMTGKWSGRVGDSPIVGAGGVADNDAGAVSTTGTGELIIRFGLARAVLTAFEAAAGPVAAGRPPGAAADAGAADAAAAAAVDAALARMRHRLRGEDTGEGVIFVSRDGGIGVGHSSPRMSWASASVDVGAAGAGAGGAASAPTVHSGFCRGAAPSGIRVGPEVGFAGGAAGP